ncbi:hypothetical protein APHACPA_1524 [Rickettsia amblyommatis str. Ac/Pa]|uniref:Uncharacterized protein n=1 Tax=Rickettsia amblyommatis str. Ac/Pa TaxID=1359164 RepID=A0A0F3N330_RICAM|nr:hypothetical protein APHACPA_1524 [Rickettsia amblyommatis str. Ac/Pa]
MVQENLGFGQKQIICFEALVSAIELGTACTPPIVIGNKHFQQTSVIGFTNLPVQPIDA